MKKLHELKIAKDYKVLKRANSGCDAELSRFSDTGTENEGMVEEVRAFGNIWNVVGELYKEVFEPKGE